MGQRAPDANYSDVQAKIIEARRAIPSKAGVASSGGVRAGRMM
jgi:hypothetical protein